MIEFETQIDKLKHKVLVEVAKLAKENKLSKESIEKIPYTIIKGDTAMYRCCVYKERAIVLERAKLAAGYLANGDNEYHDLIDITPDDQIIYVIEAACDKCPLNKYTVTDSCRNCLAHRCQKACKFGAISYVAGRAYINQDLCKECGMCKRACPYDAISEVMRPCKKVCPTGALEVNPENRRAMINEDDCINCGTCMSACPFGAISDKSFIVPVANQLSTKQKIYAIIAPAIVNQFGRASLGQIKTAIKKLGFKDAVEVALGADMVTVAETKEFEERMKNGSLYMTNSCCPAFGDYIRKKYPEEAVNISSTVSPMIAIARLIKEQDKDGKVVFIGPCTAKKKEASQDSSVDYVITFEELAALFDAFDVDIDKCEEDNSIGASIFGRGYALSGGLTSSINQYVKESKSAVNFMPLKISGPIEIKKTMKMAKLKRVKENFIEGMMCEGGCLNGPGAIVPINRSRINFGIINRKNGKDYISRKEIKECCSKIIINKIYPGKK